MSNTPGPAVASPSKEHNSSRPDRSGLKKTPSDSGPASLSDDPWVKALFGFSQAVAARPLSKQHKARDISETETDSEPGFVQESRCLQPDRTVGETTTALYSPADLAPQLANPLSALRDRDRQALIEIFDHEHMVTVEADILTRLSYLVPEPPWDIEPHEFLREFL